MDGFAKEFWQAFYQRTMYWAYVSQARALFLSDCALAQAKFESANFTSNVFEKNMNPIGYKTYSGSLWQTGAGSGAPEGGTYARFPNVAAAACELADWIHRRKAGFVTCDSLEQYCKLMKQFGYFGDQLSVYTSGLENYFQASYYDDASTEEPSGVEETVKELLTPGKIVFYVAVILVIFVLRTSGLFKVFRRALS